MGCGLYIVGGVGLCLIGGAFDPTEHVVPGMRMPMIVVGSIMLGVAIVVYLIAKIAGVNIDEDD